MESPVNKMKQMLAGILAATMLLSSLPTQAGIVGTEQMLSQDSREVSLGKVQTFMASEQVAAQFASLGVAPEMIAERVAALSETELQQLAANIDAQPAGGDALIIVGIVFVVLLILELVGVTNIFNRV